MARPRNNTKKQQQQQQLQSLNANKTSRSNSNSDQPIGATNSAAEIGDNSKTSEPQAEETQDPIELAWRNGTNADIAAMRATLTLLQMQRLQAQRDIRLLEDQKTKATAQPEAYARALYSGRLDSSKADIFSGDENIELDEDTKGANSVVAEDGFRRLPRRQDVASCPRINWEKYGIDGVTLDRIHHQQLNGQG